MSKFPHIKQINELDCGPTCLKMIAALYGITFDSNIILNTIRLSRKGSNLLDISDAAEKIGFKTSGLLLSIEQLNDVTLPSIVHLKRKHFAVLFKIENGIYHIADPANTIFNITKAEFSKYWLGNKRGMGKGVILTFSL